MPILGIMASQISGHLVTNSYESIQTVTVGSGGSSSITFSSIPSTYKHLQIRSIARINSANYGPGEVMAEFNADQTWTNYYRHGIGGTGASVFADAAAASSNLRGVLCGYNVGGSTATTWMAAGICDILDYTNTNKYKTVRSLVGADLNGTPGGTSGYMNLYSGLWMSTAAINQIVITSFASQSFTEYSQFALYGIRGA
jgi:hypothetical protein